MEDPGIVFEPRNILAEETSPYLLQHAANPVHWRPWGQDAMREARQRDCPILLSVGYAACHWCHVMAHESFEDEEVAALMNSLYVNVKVDREERPDIDQIFMASLSSMGEQGGWPLTMFLTPAGQPFWGGTYFPKEPHYGRPGFIQILNAVHRAWTEKRSEIDQSASSLAGHVHSRLSHEGSGTAAPVDLHSRLATSILSMMDMEKGGLRGAPKFPNAPFLHALWLNWLSSGDVRSRDAVLLSLRKMLAGGIYDHVGGGLARYSTDADWMIPHFEKMLYDNALVIRLANWAYADTGAQLFRDRIEQTIDWLVREMLTEDGLASSLDADSEGEEGRFYTWTEDQLARALQNDFEDIDRFYSMGNGQHWEHAPVLYQSDAQIEASSNDPEGLKAIRERLLQDRESRRVRPGRDDKVLTDWNGLAIQALAETGRTFQRSDWIETAVTLFDRIVRSADRDGRLPHSVRGDKRLYPAFSSDYAAMINAAVSLYEATGEQRLLAKGRDFLEQLDRWHADENGLGYFLTASDSADVPMRIRGDVDEAVPSANAQIIEAITRLASATTDFDLARRAEGIADRAVSRIRDQQFGQAGIVNAASIARNPITLALVEDQEGRFIAVANRIPDPRRVDIVSRLGQGGDIPELAEGLFLPTDMLGAWLCTNRSCLPAIVDPEELERALGHGSRPS